MDSRDKSSACWAGAILESPTLNLNRHGAWNVDFALLPLGTSSLFLITILERIQHSYKHLLFTFETYLSIKQGPAKMKRDTLEPFGKNHSCTSDCHAQVVKAAGCTLRREDTQKWAQNLRFLVYGGDYSEEERDEDKDDEDEDDEDEYDEDEDETEAGDSEDREDGGDREDGDNWSPFSECVKCRGLPYFPHWSHVKELRLTSDLELGDCSDYLAVSYCWSQDRSDSSSSSTTKPNYVISKPDGTKRPSIAPKEILDRAIYIAANNGLRLIWIDQECIDQDNRMDKEFGIQSMDVVFERAAMVIGPLSLTIESDIEWKALKLLKIDENLSESDFYRTASARLAEHGLEVLGILESLVSERWFTRAWILQVWFIY